MIDLGVSKVGTTASGTTFINCGTISSTGSGDSAAISSCGTATGGSGAAIVIAGSASSSSLSESESYSSSGKY